MQVLTERIRFLAGHAYEVPCTGKHRSQTPEGRPWQGSAIQIRSNHRRIQSPRPPRRPSFRQATTRPSRSSPKRPPAPDRATETP